MQLFQRLRSTGVIVERVALRNGGHDGFDIAFEVRLQPGQLRAGQKASNYDEAQLLKLLRRFLINDIVHGHNRPDVEEHVDLTQGIKPSVIPVQNCEPLTRVKQRGPRSVDLGR